MLTYGGESSGWRPGKNPTIKVKRKNGTFAGFVSGSKQSRSNASKRNEREEYKQNLLAGKPTTPPGAQAAAGRRSQGSRYPTNSEYNATAKKYRSNIKNKKSDSKTDAEMRAFRADRANRGNFRGKYYGPDAFKGNLGTLDEWRKAGSPKDTKAFAKGRNKGTEGRRRSNGRGD